MRALALDIGEVRVGIAASDASGRIASPVKVLPAPDVLVCGRPQTLSGEDGPQAERLMAQAKQIADACDLPLEFADERLSSAEAKRILREEGLRERDMRGKVDMVAASLFLQAWLDARRSQDDAARG